MLKRFYFGLIWEDVGYQKRIWEDVGYQKGDLFG